MSVVNAPGVSKSPRGICSACGRDYAITKAGEIRHHGEHGWQSSTCPGSLRPPKEAR